MSLKKCAYIRKILECARQGAVLFSHLSLDKCKFFWLITLMEFCYNNFGIELLDDDDVLLLRGPLRLCPAHLLITGFDLCACVQSHLSLHLLQQGGQQLINWLKRLGVAFLCQRHVVKHVMMRNGAVNLKTNDQI